MSSYYYKEPKPGDVVEHPLYGWVTLIDTVNVRVATDNFWLATRDNLEYVIVAESDLKNIQNDEEGEEE
jgi:hypothetical protein